MAVLARIGPGLVELSARVTAPVIVLSVARYTGQAVGRGGLTLVTAREAVLAFGGRRVPVSLARAADQTLNIIGCDCALVAISSQRAPTWPRAGGVAWLAVCSVVVLRESAGGVVFVVVGNELGASWDGHHLESADSSDEVLAHYGAAYALHR